MSVLVGWAIEQLAHATFPPGYYLLPFYAWPRFLHVFATYMDDSWEAGR